MVRLLGLSELLTDWRAKEPEWFDLAAAAPELYVGRLSEDISSVLDLRARPTAGLELSEQELQPGLAFCELCILHFTDLALICFERQNEHEQLLWTSFQETKGSFHLQMFATNLANSLAGVRLLILHGHDTQAKVLLRHFVELADALLACTAEASFFELYRNAEPEPHLAFRYWQKHLRPARVRHVLDRLDATLGLPQNLQSATAGIRAGTYRWLSNWSHVHPLGVILSAVGRYTDDQGRLHPKFGGLRDSSCRVTLSRASTYSWYTVIMLMRMLATPDHGWFALLTKNDSQRAEFAFRSELIKRYYLANASQIRHVEADDENDDAIEA